MRKLGLMAEIYGPRNVTF